MKGFVLSRASTDFRGKDPGVLVYFQPRNITEQEFTWLRMFADQAAVAITNAQAFEQAGQALEELQQSETKYRSLLDLSPVAIYLVDILDNLSPQIRQV